MSTRGTPATFQVARRQTTRPGGAELLREAMGRSLALVILCVFVGAVALDVIKGLEGPRYAADAHVLISTTPISRILTGTEPPVVDPQRVEETARALASAPEIYAKAAAQAHGKLGTASDLASATIVSGGTSNDILVFTAKSSQPTRAVDIANAVASEYITWRADLSGASIKAAVAQIQKRIAGLGGKGPAVSDLQTQLNRLELLLTLNTGDAILVQRAAQTVKTTPRPVRDTLLGAALGLVIGLLIAAAREAIDTKVRSEGEVESVLAAPVLAAVPTQRWKPRAIGYGRQEQMLTDSYAMLAANLVQSNDGAGWEVLAVTSAISREGKTTTAVNLAVALARRGTNVLVVDFDFRRPMLGEFFGIPTNATGALQVLAGEASLEEALWRVPLNGPNLKPMPSADLDARQDGAAPAASGDQPVGSLEVLPAGGVARPDRVVHSPTLATLLKQLRSRAELVILDTPPALMTVEVTELGSVIDGVLIVVREGRVSQRSLRTLSKQAQAWPVEVVGAVLTDTSAQEGYGPYYRGR